jgi:hypothetical protein
MLDQHVKFLEVRNYKIQVSYCEDAFGFDKRKKVVQNNMVLFGGLELILSVLCLLPMLEVLIEFALCGDVLIVEFVNIV